MEKEEERYVRAEERIRSHRKDTEKRVKRKKHSKKIPVGDPCITTWFWFDKNHRYLSIWSPLPKEARFLSPYDWVQKNEKTPKWKKSWFPAPYISYSHEQLYYDEDTSHTQVARREVTIQRVRKTVLPKKFSCTPSMLLDWKYEGDDVEFEEYDPRDTQYVDDDNTIEETDEVDSEEIFEEDHVEVEQWENGYETD